VWVAAEIDSHEGPAVVDLPGQAETRSQPQAGGGRPAADRATLAKDHPKDSPKRFNVEVTSYVESIVGPFKKTLLMLAPRWGCWL